MHRTRRMTQFAIVAAAMLLSLTGAGAQQSDLNDLLKTMIRPRPGGKTAPVELIDFREMKKALPEKLEGMARKSAAGEKSGAFGILVATAEAAYRGEEGSEVAIKMSDIGGMGDFARMAQLGWTQAEMERETEHGYERTFTHKGHKARVEYDRRRQTGKYNLIIGDRLVLEVDGRRVSEQVLKAALDAVDLNHLAKLTKTPG